MNEKLNLSFIILRDEINAFIGIHNTQITQINQKNDNILLGYLHNHLKMTN